ncbi:S-adenosyl-L-methionine-dependent methyltransferase [Ceratobasidium sp. AG-I]|nr:S-adenosyl-L-methionine-dependent methyltransferase [Ceratobasidium sp. AG-I]
MDDSEWDMWFATQASSNLDALTAPDEPNPTISGYTPTETDTEGQISPAPSVYSLTSSLHEQSFRHVHGRNLNAHSDVYSFPADEEEVSRLYKQHRMFYLLARNDHHYGLAGRVQEALAPTSERQRRVLDLGCGPGAWTIQCALDFPHADVLGVDLAPTTTIVPPPNCRFEIDDVNLGLDHFFGPTFDVIHARLLNAGVRDYAGLVDQISRCLRPGGLVLFAEIDYRIWAEDKRLLIPPNFYTPLPMHGRPPLGLSGSSRSGSRSTRCEKVPTVLTNWAVPTWMATMTKCMRAKGGNIDAATLLKSWMGEHRNYTNVQATDIWSPLCPYQNPIPSEWASHPDFSTIGEMSRDNMLGFMSSARPLLYEWFSKGEVAELEDKAIRELEACENRMFIRVQITSAQRK